MYIVSRYHCVTLLKGPNSKPCCKNGDAFADLTHFNRATDYLLIRRTPEFSHKNFDFSVAGQPSLEPNEAPILIPK